MQNSQFIVFKDLLTIYLFIHFQYLIYVQFLSRNTHKVNFYSKTLKTSSNLLRVKLLSLVWII